MLKTGNDRMEIYMHRSDGIKSVFFFFYRSMNFFIVDDISKIFRSTQYNLKSVYSSISYNIISIDDLFFEEGLCVHIYIIIIVSQCSCTANVQLVLFGV